jgi:hypothetical protein
MIPKFNYCTVVSHVKAPLKELAFVSVLYAVTIVCWREKFITLVHNLNNMPPLDEGINCIPHGLHVEHPISFVSYGQRIAALIDQIIKVEKHQDIHEGNHIVISDKPLADWCILMMNLFPLNKKILPFIRSAKQDDDNGASNIVLPCPGS